MVQGRQPAGLCGACIILAARMNNFRRTVREVVYVVKVADSTINSRLYEYKKTPSSVLTVNQFREFGLRVKPNTLPPAIWRREEKEERKRRREEVAAGADCADSAEALEDSGDSEPEAGPSTAPTRKSKRRKTNDGDSQEVALQGESSNISPRGSVDAAAFDGSNDNMLEHVAATEEEVEATGIAPDDLAYVLPKKKRGRPKKRSPVVIPPEELEIEEQIEGLIQQEIIDWEQKFKDVATSPEDSPHPLLRQSGWSAQQIARAELDRRDIEEVSTDPEIGDEYDDDPDIATCILGPEEVRIKERIWIMENAEWLREQQKKLLEAELDKARDLPKKPKQTRQRNRMGDGAVLEGQPAASAADAAHKMLKKRGKPFSNHINYDRLKELFPMGDTTSSPSGGGSGQGVSPANSQVVRTPPVIQAQDEDAEGEDDEEYEEPAQQQGGFWDDAEDLEAPYQSDPDEYGNDNYDETY